MKLRTFTAGSLVEALAMVKRQMGPHAVVLHTRAYKAGGFLGLGARRVIEVTAGDARVVGPRAAVASPAKSASSKPARAKSSLAADATAGELIRKTYALAQAQMKQRVTSDVAAVITNPPPTAPPPIETNLPHQQLATEVATVKRMVAQVVNMQRTSLATLQSPELAGLADPLVEHYQAMLSHEVAKELALKIVHDVHARLSTDELADVSLVRTALRNEIARLIPVDGCGIGQGTTPDGRPRTIALIGPTGVGKTTTVAKLAAQLKLKAKKRVALFTLDTYRIAAVDQLRTYAEIIGVPLRVADQPQDLAEQVRSVQDVDVILIDTAGRSQRDDRRLDQLSAMLQAAQPHETHLVLSSTGSRAAIQDAVTRFSRLKYDKIILTKLDEAVSLGVLLNVSSLVDKRLSFVTTGQEVPQDIEVGRADRLAALVVNAIEAGVERC
ncbi:MAG: flagellar biosynthesis protein FlhF [Phycisphaeraceae bacterium]|nr:flagellar biosynthesis protein FlhF [Phycisphaeraceae bacterium]